MALVAEQLTTNVERGRGPRRRERGATGPRVNRLKISYNDTELALVLAAAERDHTAPASWIGHTALAVASEILVPVSADANDVLRELIRARNQLLNAGRDVTQAASTMGASDAHCSELQTALRAFQDTVRRVDAATVQVMRERRRRQ